MVRSRTWPPPGVGTAQSSIRKSDALGSPTGREARTMRFADWDMVVSSDFIAFRHCERSDLSAIAQRAKAEAIHSCRRQRWIASSLTLLAMTVYNSGQAAILESAASNAAAAAGKSVKAS